jgi:hypothetical protein
LKMLWRSQMKLRMARLMNTAITGSRYKTIQTRRLPNACAPMNENGWQGCARPAVGPPIDGSGLARSVPGGPDHDQDDPGRGRDAQIGRPKNDRCLGRLSKAHAWAGLSDWLKNPACARHLAEVPTHSTCAPGRRDSTPHPAWTIGSPGAFPLRHLSPTARKWRISGSSSAR